MTTIIAYAFCIFFGLVIALSIAGEMFGHANVRRFLFWVRGRSEQTGAPVRRFPLP